MAVGKFPDQLNPIAYAAINPAADLDMVWDDSANELAYIAAVERIKRSLGSADVAWMTALALSGVDAAADKFMIFDNSATGFRAMTASELLNVTFAGAAHSGITALANMAAVDGAADYLIVFDNSALGWRKILASEFINRLLPSTTTVVTSTPTTRTTGESGRRFTNFGATQITEHDLPAGAAGLRYSFMRQADFAVRVDPNGSEIIGGGAAGKYLEITSTRGQVDLEWMSDSGTWEVTGGSAVFAFEA